MDRNRLWVLGAAVLIAATAVLGWLLGISPHLIEASTAKAAQATVETQNATYEAQVAALETQYEGIGKLKDDLAELQLAVPGAANLPAFLAQLDSIGQQHQVTLAGITVSDAQLYVPVVATVPVDVAAPTDGSTPAPAAEVAATGVAPAATEPTLSPLISPANFVSVPITLTVDGDYVHILDFIEGLQKGKRLVMVTTFNTVAKDPGAGASTAAATEDSTAPAIPASGGVTANISALIYVLLNPATAAPTPVG